jgi:hypothetical protein
MVRSNPIYVIKLQERSGKKRLLEPQSMPYKPIESGSPNAPRDRPVAHTGSEFQLYKTGSKHFPYRNADAGCSRRMLCFHPRFPRRNRAGITSDLPHRPVRFSERTHRTVARSQAPAWTPPRDFEATRRNRVARIPRLGAKTRASRKIADCTRTMQEPVEPLIKKLT